MDKNLFAVAVAKNLFTVKEKEKATATDESLFAVEEDSSADEGSRGAPRESV